MKDKKFTIDDEEKIENPIDPYLTVGKLKMLINRHNQLTWVTKRIRNIKEITDDEWTSKKLNEVYEKIKQDE